MDDDIVSNSSGAFQRIEESFRGEVVEVSAWVASPRSVIRIHKSLSIETLFCSCIRLS